MDLSRDGARRFPAALQPNELDQLEQALAGARVDRPGIRLTGLRGLPGLLLPDGPIGRLAADHLGPGTRPVRALLFDKNADLNWSLGWHKDRTVAVRERSATPGFSNWTIKAGIQHVEPPFELLERMLTLRVHLDPVGPANAPLLIALGSHRLGRVTEHEIPALAAQLSTYACLAAPGDIWVYSTPILHASEAAVEPSRRRVLQVDYSASDLPHPLEWSGI